ncbi:MAG: Ig-like domain-containing protein, partial [Planctomycetes bacterium]|nr:Ig-like domain-containing protein [Planctomycetota bacterium]
STIQLIATDAGSGVKELTYKVDSGAYVVVPSTSTLPLYHSITLPLLTEGRHTIYYSATDQLGNGEEIKQAMLVLDVSAPESQIAVNSAQVTVNEEKYLVSLASFTITAQDTGSGVKEIQYMFDDQPWQVSISTSTTLPLYHSTTLSLALPDGLHALKYYALDNLGGAEETKTFAFKTDATKPVSELIVAGLSLIVEGKTFITGDSLVITAADPVVNEVSSGIKEINYRVNSAAWTVYASSFTITGDGETKVEYYSQDQLGNTEDIQAETFWIDNVPPETEIHVAGSWFVVDGKSYINDQTKINLTTTDAGSGIKELTYKVDSGAYIIVPSTSTLPLYHSTTLPLLTEGRHTIYYSATDKLGNTELEKNYVLYVDTTAPATSFKITDTSYEVTEGTITYVNSKIPFLISALDPLSQGVSSGLKHIKTKLDANDYATILSSSCYIATNSPDGLHTIIYYALDNVGNSEPASTYAAIFDSTKPQVKETWPANKAKVKAKKAVPIKITFSEPVKSADWANDIALKESGKVVEWYSGKEGPGNSKKDFTITYDSATDTLSIDGQLKNNREYEVTLKNTISDRVRNYLDTCWFSFRTMMSAKEGGTITDAATGLTLIIPPNALPCDGYFELALLDQTSPPKLPKPLKWLFDGRKAYQIIFYDENGAIVQQQVTRAFKVIVVLKQQWIALALESDPVEYKNIKVYQTGSVTDKGAPGVWRADSQSENTGEKSQFAPRLLSPQSYNEQEQELTVDLDGFGIFALAGFNAPGASLDDLSCYPNPFNPNKQQITVQYYLENDSDVAIAIYDLLGNLVKTWEIPAGEQNARAGLNQLAWNGRNGPDDIVANGGYIVFVHSDGQKKKFKILVVK